MNIVCSSVRLCPAKDDSWKRIEVADGIELLVREDVYRRRKDEIEHPARPVWKGEQADLT